MILDLERNSDEYILTADKSVTDVKLHIQSLSLRVLNYTLNENLYNKVRALAKKIIDDRLTTIDIADCGAHEQRVASLLLSTTAN